MIVSLTQNYYSSSIIILLLLLQDTFYSQTLNFGHISVEDGLSNSFVNCLLQDQSGFIWFGTDDGLNRFDGYDIKVYRNNPDDKNSLSDNIIWALWEDHSGNILIGTKTGGLNKFNPDKESFEHWDLDSNLTDKINITYLYEDSRKNIWIGTYSNGVYRFNSSKNKFDLWQNYPGKPKLLTNNFVTSIIEDQTKNIWIGTYSGLNKFIPKNSEISFDHVIKDLTDPIWYLKKSSYFNNTILIGSLNGLLKFDPVKETLTDIPLPESFGSQFGSSVSSIAEESFYGEKVLWVGTFGGLVQLNLNDGFSKRFLQSDDNKTGLVSNQIHDIIVDRSGVLWIATENGLNFLSQKRSKFNSITSEENLAWIIPKLSDKNVRAITQAADHSIWFGTDAGLIGINNSAYNKSATQNSELQSLNVWSLFSGSANKLWIGNYGQGLKEFDLNTNQLKSLKVSNPQFNVSAFDYVKTVIEDEDGMIWMGFWGAGLARLNPKTSKIDYWRNEKNNHLSLSQNDVWVLYKDSRGRIWIGTNGGGLNLYSGNSQNNFYNWNTGRRNVESQMGNSIYTICESVNSRDLPEQTILWIGTANGLNKFIVDDSASIDSSKPDVNISHYTVEDGLPDNAVESILEDQDGNLWIGTSSGISFFNVLEETFTNFTAADGLSGSSFNSSASIKTYEGTMLFGSTRGLNYFNPERIKQSNYSPQVVITDFQIINRQNQNRDSSLVNSGYFNSKKFDLSYDQNDFSFQFAALDYNAPEMNEYAYFLEGFDKDWIYSGKRRFVTYTNLDPGEYVFQVKGTNSDGLWSENIAKVFIVIDPPFWMTWWAYSIYGIIFIGGLYLIRDTEIKRRKKKEEERLRREREEAQLREAKLKSVTIEQQKELEKQKIRNRIAQDLHDEIGSNLSSISLMSELVQKDGKINQEALEKISRIQKVARGSSQSMRDIVWLTNPSSDSIKDLISKMNEVANDMLGGLKWKFNFPENVSEISLVPEVKRNFFFIYKESLNNILKHANAKNVEIDFKVVEDKILLKIKDDGNGFDTTSTFSGNGLKNLQSRANEINGELRIESSQKNGTAINLSVNITQMRD